MDTGTDSPNVSTETGDPKRKIRPLQEVLQDIQKYLPAGAMVVGYCVTARTTKSVLQVKWGTNRIKRKY